MVDFKAALMDPGAMFNEPREIVERKDLPRAQKIEILRRWEHDARALQVADEEGMVPDSPQPTLLDAVLQALRAVGAPADVERSAPTKQGGS